MHDPRARRHHAEIIKSVLAPTQEFVPFFVTDKFEFDIQVERVAAGKMIDLHRMVDHQVGRHQRVNLFRIAPQSLHGRPHRRQINHRRHTRKILQHDPRRLKRHLDRRRPFRVGPTGQRLHIVLSNDIPVAIPQARFEQHANRKRQLIDFRQPRLLQRRQAINPCLTATSIKSIAGRKRIGF